MPGDVVQGPLEQMEFRPKQFKVGHTTLLKLLQPYYLDARRWRAAFTNGVGPPMILVAYSLSSFGNAGPELTQGLPLPTADEQQGGGSLVGVGGKKLKLWR